jgi:hypothetical protein
MAENPEKISSPGTKKRKLKSMVKRNFGGENIRFKAMDSQQNGYKRREEDSYGEDPESVSSEIEEIHEQDFDSSNQMDLHTLAMTSKMIHRLQHPKNVLCEP